ncbi:23S rRNA 5-hydroxycytidine synthase, partial [Clarias magur]
VTVKMISHLFDRNANKQARYRQPITMSWKTHTLSFHRLHKNLDHNWKPARVLTSDARNVDTAIIVNQCM